MKHITDIFFDLDHTLWDFDENSKVAFNKIFKNLNLPIDINFFIATYAPINQACWKLFQVDKITHQELRYERLKKTFDALEFSISDTLIEDIAEAYINYLPESSILFEDAITVLEYLSTKYKLHIITNGFAEVQDKKLINANIKNYFQTVTNSEMAGVKKPNPKIFEYALSIANASKEKSVMIGDCIDADVNGALQFGIEAIWFNANNQKTESTKYEIHRLSELQKIF